MNYDDKAHRRLEKKLNNAGRDMEGNTIDAKQLNKAQRNYSKALIDAALEEDEQDSESYEDVCVMCEKPCKSLTCSDECHEEYIKLNKKDK